MAKLVLAAVGLCLVVFAIQSVRGAYHSSWSGDQCNADCSYPVDCSGIFDSGQTKSSVYMIQPLTYPEPFYVYCDMDTDGGGWTIFQRRQDGSVGFYRNWADYREGFGNVNSEYWLGNERLFYLTAQGSYELRIDLEDFEGERRYAAYDHFRIGDEETFYKLFIGEYSGDAGNSLGLTTYHPNQPFSTKDADHDGRTINCATTYSGAWWYGDIECHKSNLNGQYLAGEHESFADGVIWFHWRGHNYSLKVTEMKIRRL